MLHDEIKSCRDMGIRLYSSYGLFVFLEYASNGREKMVELGSWFGVLFRLPIMVP
jgi:hypothetical protein